MVISDKMIRTIFLLKGLVIVVGVLIYFNQIWVGEKPLPAAAEEPQPKGKEGDAANPKVVEDNSPVNLNIEDAPEPEGLVAQTEVNDENFGALEGLLELPPLNKDDKDSIGKYLTLAERARQQINDRIRFLENRAELLQGLEQTIEAKLDKLDQEKQFFTQTVQKEKELQEERVKVLVELYEKMEPKKAGPMMEKMDKDLVVSLFQNLKKKQVTAILESMTPEKSVEITEYFGRVGSAREYDMLKEINKSLKDAFDKCKS